VAVGAGFPASKWGRPMCSNHRGDRIGCGKAICSPPLLTSHDGPNVVNFVGLKGGYDEAHRQLGIGGISNRVALPRKNSTIQIRGVAGGRGQGVSAPQGGPPNAGRRCGARLWPLLVGERAYRRDFDNYPGPLGTEKNADDPGRHFYWNPPGREKLARRRCCIGPLCRWTAYVCRVSRFSPT